MTDLNKVKVTDEIDLNDDTPQSPVNTGADENRGLDDFVAEATKTKADAVLEEKAIKAEEVFSISEEEAADYALQGLGSSMQFVSGRAKVVVDLPVAVKMVFATMMTPLIMKYGPKIIKLLRSPSKVDLDSRLPEVMGALATAGVAGPIIWQVLNAKPEEQNTDKEESNHGN